MHNWIVLKTILNLKFFLRLSNSATDGIKKTVDNYQDARYEREHFSQQLINLYQPTRPHVPRDHDLQIHHRENVKWYTRQTQKSVKRMGTNI
jgi:hypothetical protein